MSALGRWLANHVPADEAEAVHLARTRSLVADAADSPWSRELPLHLTGSALVVHPPTGRVLLRWHEHLGRYLHVGGHGDPGESDPYAVALREATEETGLEDLVPFPGPEPLLVQVAVVSVPERRKERAHEHADLRFLLSTSTPELAVPEKPQAVLVWRSVAEARSEVGNDGLGACLDRVGLLLAGLGGNADR